MKEQGTENISEDIIDETFPNMGKETVTQGQETQRVSCRIKPKRNTPRHIVIKMTKIKGKEKTLEAAGENQQITCKGIPITLPAAFSAETADQSDFSSSFSSSNSFSSSHVQM